MKKIFLVLTALLFLLLPFAALFAQTPDTAFVQAAENLYQPKANKGGVAISPSAPLPLFRKADGKIQYIKSSLQGQIDNANSVIALKANVTSIDTAKAAIRSEMSDKYNYVDAKIDGKTLSISGQNLTLSGGNTVELPFSTADSSFRMVGSNMKGGSTALINANTAMKNVVAIGDSALYSLTSSNNIGVTAIGNGALRNFTSRTAAAVAIGYQAMYRASTTGVAIGQRALYSNTSGGNNVGVGQQSLLSVTTGGQNIGIGANAGNSITTGSDNIVIGAYLNVPNTTGSNQLNIGNWITGIDGKIAMPSIPVFADDATADADTALISGSFYRITGSRVVYQKP